MQSEWNGWRKVSGVICDRRLPARVKRKVYSSVVRPVMVYELETVAVTKKQAEGMKVADTNVEVCYGNDEKRQDWKPEVQLEVYCFSKFSAVI